MTCYYRCDEDVFHASGWGGTLCGAAGHQTHRETHHSQQGQLERALHGRTQAYDAYSALDTPHSASCI